MKLKNYQIELLYESVRGDWHPNEETGLVDVNGDVHITLKNLGHLPVKFGKVTGNFNCSDSNLITLEGTPRIVEGIFNCSFNDMKTLEGGPIKTRKYLCHDCENLVSLKGAPDKVIEFDCSGCDLTTLEYAPVKVRDEFICSYNKLTSLEHCPKSVKIIRANCNEISDLNGPNIEVDYFYIWGSPLKTLKGNVVIRKGLSIDLEHIEEKYLDEMLIEIMILESEGKEITGRTNFKEFKNSFLNREMLKIINGDVV